MKTIFCVRHADYLFKTEDKDILPEERPKARLIGQNMDPKPQLIYTSESLRAITSSQCIAEGAGGVEVKQDRLLGEYSVKPAIDLFLQRLFPELEENNIDTIAIVSHEPTLKKMLDVKLPLLGTRMIQRETWEEIAEVLADTNNIWRHAKYIDLLKK